jgi:hypothetical protein
MARYNGRAIGFYNQALCNRLCQTALKSEKARRILGGQPFMMGRAALGLVCMSLKFQHTSTICRPTDRNRGPRTTIRGVPRPGKLIVKPLAGAMCIRPAASIVYLI